MKEILKKIKTALRSIPPLSLVYTLIGCVVAFFLPVPYICLYTALLSPVVWLVCFVMFIVWLKPKRFFHNFGYLLWRSLLVLLVACGIEVVCLLPFAVAITAFLNNQQGMLMGDPDNLPSSAFMLIYITIVLSLILSFAVAYRLVGAMKALRNKVEEREQAKSKLKKIITE